MSKSESAPGAVRPTIERNPDSLDGGDAIADGDEMLSLMSDDYAQQILDALGEEPLAARELVDRLDASRATVYRRLNRLESAGVVESSMTIHPEGHHRKEFRTTVERMDLVFGSDGVTVDVLN
jgi:DNA-binding transcriptional ArsR family regulator